MGTIFYRGAVVSVPSESEEVYLPAEDSYLLADGACEALCGSPEKGLEGLFDIKDTADVLEIGCGSGFVSAVLMAAAAEESRVHPQRKMILTACDINPAAVALSRENGVPAQQSDLFGIFGPDDVFDMILFNPPYLPTSDDEKVPGWLNYAFDGGPAGRDTILRFLDGAANHLRPDGFFLLLISSITGQAEVAGEMEKRGFSSTVAGTAKCSFEELMVLRGERRHIKSDEKRHR